MNKSSEQFTKGIKNMNLTVEEKSVIRQSVLNFISRNPVSSVAPTMVPILPKFLIWLSRLIDRGFSMLKASEQNRGLTIGLRPIGAILLIMVIFVGGGVAVGAEKSLPGDILYPVKVGLSEEVRGWLSVSEESKANWEVERAQRRLEEAETLASEGSLDIETREKIEANFEAHAERVKERIVKFESKENFKAAADVSSKFETSLKAHHKILNRLTAETAETKDEVKKEVRPIQFRVQSEAKAWAKTRKDMELRAGGSVKAESADEDEDNEEIELKNETETDLELNLDNGTIKSQSRLKAGLGL
ncbi:MAG: DUF5667 domain-containing protein [Candidatus Taylorbacteria bacterium]|nr:DUF5667 domain-containing protein [Candidatus Taylorbacteria bacterium]